MKTKFLVMSFAMLVMFTQIGSTTPQYLYEPLASSQLDDSYGGGSESVDADTVDAWSRHAVKIREDVRVKDVYGNERNVKDASSGSGVVIAADGTRGTSLVMTANHVCVAALPVGSAALDGRLLIIASKKTIVDYDGNLHEMVKIIYQSRDDDVCVMEVTGIAGTPVEIAPLLPPKKAKIFAFGAPLGVWDDGVVHVSEGRYIGIKKNPILVGFSMHFNFLQYSLPSVGGMSGSGVLYNGRLIGLITCGISNYRYENIAWGPGLEQIRRAADASMADWKKSFVEKIE